VYLVEAADDICYNIIDLEDAHHLKILSYQEVEELLLPLCGSENLRDRLDGLLDTPSRVALLRAKAINTLIKGCVDVFVREQEQFLSGTFSSALMDALDDSIVKQMSKISKISIAKIYNAPTVVQIEIAGYRVMDALLKEFVPAYLKKNKNNYDKKLVALIPEQFYTDKQDSYSKIRSVLDFVSGMTDVYAIELYRKIKGITIPSIE